MNYLWLRVLCLALTPLGASQIIEIDSNQLLQCTFSSRHHNRIAVEGKRIKKVIYPDGDISIRMEEESGQIFLQAMVEAPEVTTVSIVTSEGVVQDLEISFIDKASEILILKEPVEEEICLRGVSPWGSDEIDAIQNAIDSLLSGILPEEYVPVEDRSICYRIKKKVNLSSVMRLVGPLYTIYMLTIENNGRRGEQVQEDEINCIEGEWVFLEKNYLGCRDKMLALIGVKTYEQ